METNVNYTIVGIFVITAITAMVMGIIWLSSGFSLDQSKIYAVNMQESVSGLSIDSPVEFNGVEVGSVKSIEIDKKDPKLVILLLSVKNNTPVSLGTVATLASKGITGITFVALKDKGESQLPLEVLPGQKYPIIKSAPSLFVRLGEALTQLSENVKSVSKDINTLLSKENLESLHQTLANLQRITGTMAANSKQIEAILHNTALFSKKLDPLIITSTNTLRVLEVQTLPATYRMLSNLDAATRSLAEITEEIKANPSVIIRGINRNNYGPGEQR
jgi:phospholipid/cholesterol/gamma-HCH transport system substrate-binding protein